jgi:hypothetical protein
MLIEPYGGSLETNVKYRRPNAEGNLREAL